MLDCQRACVCVCSCGSSAGREIPQRSLPRLETDANLAVCTRLDQKKVEAAPATHFPVIQVGTRFPKIGPRLGKREPHCTTNHEPQKVVYLDTFPVQGDGAELLVLNIPINIGERETFITVLGES